MFPFIHFRYIQRRLDSRPQSIMGIERLIPRVASLTVDCRGVNISLTIKPIWKLSNDKSVRLRYFVKTACYCCVVAIIIMTCVLLYQVYLFFKLHGTCCHFSFINNPSEKRNCVSFIFPIARLFFLSWMALNLRVSST